MSWDYPKYMAERQLPADSEQFRNNIHEALRSVALNNAGLTLGQVYDFLVEKGSPGADQLNEAMSEYCFNTAISTSKHFNCKKQLFDEGPVSLWQSIYFALDDELKVRPEFKDWEMQLATSPLFRENLKQAIANTCSEYGLIFDAANQTLEIRR